MRTLLTRQHGFLLKRLVLLCLFSACNGSDEAESPLYRDSQQDTTSSAVYTDLDADTPPSRQITAMVPPVPGFAVNDVATQPDVQLDADASVASDAVYDTGQSHDPDTQPSVNTNDMVEETTSVQDVDVTDDAFITPDIPIDTASADLSPEVDLGPPPYPFVNVTVEANPNSVLSAYVTITAEVRTRVQVDFYSSDDSDTHITPESDEERTRHVVTLVGMRPETTYTLLPRARIGDGEPIFAHELTFTTDALPDGFPEITVQLHHPELFQPGVTLFGVAQVGGPPEAPFPLYIGVDHAGYVVWYYMSSMFFEATLFRNVQPLPDGNLLLALNNGARVVTPGGDIVEQVMVEQVEGISHFHHDIIRLPNGRYMAITSETQEHSVPALDSDPVELRGDVIVEFEPDGTVTWEWSTFDYLDWQRFPTELSHNESPPRVYDWTHANAIVWLQADNSVLLSLRHQNWVVKIDRSDGTIEWIFGEDGHFELTNLDPEFQQDWFYSQHAPELHSDGTLFLYDNGNDRPLDDLPENSRAVAYMLDESGAELQAEQVWQYQTEHYTPILGDTDRLPNGNVLVCAGGQPGGLPAQLVEVTSETVPTLVWELSMGTGVINRATRWSFDAEL